MSYSNYLEEKLRDHAFGGVEFTMPTEWHVSLHSANPGETGASELASTNGYARQETTFSSGATTANEAPVQFEADGGDWSEATHFGVWDAASAGNFLGGGALGTPKTVEDGDTATFDTGALTITLD